MSVSTLLPLPPPVPHFTSQRNPHSASIRRKSTNSPSASHVPHTDTHAGHKQADLNIGLYRTHTDRLEAEEGEDGEGCAHNSHVAGH